MLVEEGRLGHGRQYPAVRTRRPAAAAGGGRQVAQQHHATRASKTFLAAKCGPYSYCPPPMAPQHFQSCVVVIEIPVVHQMFSRSWSERAAAPVMADTTGLLVTKTIGEEAFGECSTFEERVHQPTRTQASSSSLAATFGFYLRWFLPVSLCAETIQISSGVKHLGRHLLTVGPCCV